MSHRQNCVGALANVDDVTLVAPRRSGIRNLINVCERFELVYDITWYQKSITVFKGIFSNVSACVFHVNGQYVEVSKCGHSISSCDKTEIVKYTKRSFWNSFNILRVDFGQISTHLKNVFFQIYCYIF